MAPGGPALSFGRRKRLEEEERGERFWRILSPIGAATLTLATVLAAISEARAADPVRGEKLYSACKACHEIGEGARHKVGPHLDGIIGRKAGSAEGFKYSSAMRKAGEEGLAWTDEALHAYLEKPRDFIKGNRMSYRGMPGAGDRDDLIAYLESASHAAPAEDTAAATKPADAPAASFVDIVMGLEGDPDYGEYLAGECVTCHQTSGKAEGIPSIVGLPRDYFIRALVEYRINVRSNEVMKLRVANLADEDIAALAAYFGSLEPQ